MSAYNSVAIGIEIGRDCSSLCLNLERNYSTPDGHGSESVHVCVVPIGTPTSMQAR
jgi:hypothetical protein